MSQSHDETYKTENAKLNNTKFSVIERKQGHVVSIVNVNIHFLAEIGKCLFLISLSPYIRVVPGTWTVRDFDILMDEGVMHETL